MIAKAVIEEVIDNFSARIRIPILNGIKNTQQSTPLENLYIANIASIPYITNVIAVGDIVYVGFENNDLSRPVIIGKYLGSSKVKGYDSIEYKPNLDLDNITVNEQCSLSNNTRIGTLEYNDLTKVLLIDELYNKLAELQEQIDELKQNKGDA